MKVHSRQTAINIITGLLLILSGVRVAMPMLHHHEIKDSTYQTDATHQTDHSHDCCIVCTWVHAIFDTYEPSILFTTIPTLDRVIVTKTATIQKGITLGANPLRAPPYLW